MGSEGRVGDKKVIRKLKGLFWLPPRCSVRGVVLSCAMFTREEASIIRQEFWTAFGKYMRPIPSAEGMKINWVNYHTGVKDIHFRMVADKHSATIYISIQHQDPEIQELYFDQFLELKELLHATLQEEWQWQLLVPCG